MLVRKILVLALLSFWVVAPSEAAFAAFKYRDKEFAFPSDRKPNVLVVYPKVDMNAQGKGRVNIPPLNMS